VDGDPQNAYQVKVFTELQYTAAGFNPDTSIALFDSGVVVGSDPGATPGVDLENGATHRAYVRAGHDLGPVVYFSDWSFTQFVVDYDSPPRPVVTASFSETSNVVYVTATGRTNYLDANDASAETTVGSWDSVQNVSVDRSTVVANFGAASIRFTGTGSGDLVGSTDPVPVAKDGQTISARADVRSDANLRDCFVSLRWFDDTSLLSSTDGVAVTNATTEWREIVVSGLPPANATRAAVAVTVQDGTSGEVHYIDRVAIHPGETPLWSPGGLYDNQIIVVERTCDCGETFDVLGEIPAGIPTQVAAFDDFSGIRGTANVFRARTIGFSGQAAVASPFSLDAAAFLVNDGRWWFKALDDPSLNLGGALVNGPLSVERAQDTGVFRPLGSDRPVVVTGSVYGADGQYQVTVIGEPEWVASEPLLMRYTGDVIVQNPFGETKTVRFINRNFVQDGTPERPRRVVSVSYVEV
jgi:hypothetical protein